MTYTIKAALPSGKKDEKYGAEYIVQVEEDARTFKMNRTTEPKPGDALDGEIVDGKYGAYFKKSQSGYPAKAAGGKPEWKDNSDGMRQGMCINNAANYLHTLEFPNGPLTDVEWADMVFSYANALYQKGDLSKVPEGSQETTNPFNPET